MHITRRDFINGMGVAVVAGMSPMDLLFANNKDRLMDFYNSDYPPALIGLRGSTDDSYIAAHLLRDGEKFDFNNLPVEERLDFVVVGAGISGLCAACLYRDKVGDKPSILILDNHDDFGGHARRNEFNIDGRLILSYGGSESFQSPKELYSKEVLDFLSKLGVNIDELAEKFDVNFYPDLGLSRGVYFNRSDFGIDKVVSGNPRRMVADDIPPTRLNGKSYEQFIGEFPMNNKDKKDLINLFSNPKDYLKGMSVSSKIKYMQKTSYKSFLKDQVKLSDTAISFFDGITDDFLALGIDSVSCEDARISFLPGFEKMGLPPLSKEDAAEVNEPYIYHFPDGNATVARLMVKRLIKGVAREESLDDLIMARFDYNKLDEKDSNTRLRLRSTVVNAKNTKNGVELVYFNSKDNKLHKIFAKKVVMANYNSMIPYIVPEMSTVQKNALSKCIKTPLIHTKVIIKNWETFMKLGIHEVYSPKMFYSRTKLDYPVNIGSYEHPRDPRKPICIHMVGAPVKLIKDIINGDSVDAREQAKLARHQLFSTPFSDLESMTRDQLQGMLGGSGFSHEDDILAITLNRWGHGYSYTMNSLYDDEGASEKIIRDSRKVFGNIAIANSDSNWDAYMHAAIEQAYRAIRDLGFKI